MSIISFGKKTLAKIAINIVSRFAQSGANTDDCLKHGFLPVPVHFYQPIPDIKDLEARNVWDKVSKLYGIKFEPKKYLKLIQVLGKKYSRECFWPNEPTSNIEEFYLNNSSFSYGCASALHSIIRELKPNRVVEVGSGHSSKIIREAIKLNNKMTKYFIIDPYSNIDLRQFEKDTVLVKTKIEEVDISFFRKLKKNDILFIDSSHVCKIGSDVNFLILEVLPILKKGVYVHFHDISLPFEYPKIYAINPRFRVFWTEAYLLQAFLSGNTNYEIVLPMTYIQNYFTKEFKKAFPKSINATNFNSGSFWIKKIK